MKKSLLILFIFITGCATEPPKMASMDSKANYDKDYYECDNESEKSISAQGSAYDNMMRSSRIKDKILLCMKARGWKETNL